MFELVPDIVYGMLLSVPTFYSEHFDTRSYPAM